MIIDEPITCLHVVHLVYKIEISQVSVKSTLEAAMT